MIHECKKHGLVEFVPMAFRKKGDKKGEATGITHRCSECQKGFMSRYNRSEKGRARNKRAQAKPTTKAKKLAYEKTEKGKARTARWKGRKKVREQCAHMFRAWGHLSPADWPVLSTRNLKPQDMVCVKCCEVIRVSPAEAGEISGLGDLAAEF